jgi:DNA polymerase-3 subunit epsilon
MRQVVLDTETTGFEVGKVAEGGDRLVEIGLVETWNYMPTGRTWHRYINPERDVPLDSFRIHGITPGYLEYMPLFEHVVEDFLDFIGDSDELVAHNAGFDFKFINFQREEIGRPPIASHRIIDTVKVARQKFPGAPASLDALCRRFKIDNIPSGRKKSCARNSR